MNMGDWFLMLRDGINDIAKAITEVDCSLGKWEKRFVRFALFILMSISVREFERREQEEKNA